VIPTPSRKRHRRRHPRNTGGFVNGFADRRLRRRNYLMMARRGLTPVPGRVILGQRALLAPTIC